MCEAVPGAALDAQPILRIARRVDSARAEPDTLSVDDDKVRAGRCPRLRVAVDEARHAIGVIKAHDVRAVRAACAEGVRPRDTGPVADNIAHTARHAPFPKVRCTQRVRRRDQAPASSPGEVGTSSVPPCPDVPMEQVVYALCSLYTSRRHTSRRAMLTLPARRLHDEQVSTLFSQNVPDRKDPL